MGERSETTNSETLEPGDKFLCRECCQHSEAVLNNSILECKICLYQIQQYDLVDYDRVQLDEEGRMSGRGAPVRLGKRPSRSSMGKFPGKTGNGRTWRYLDKVNNSGPDDGPTRSKKQTISLIKWRAKTAMHSRCSLELLDIGWPDRRQVNPNPVAIEKPIWRPAHPYGVGSSAAVCLHLAARDIGFDSKFDDWIRLCLPIELKNAASFGFRSLKRMRMILRVSRRSKTSAAESPRAILLRANLGETIYNKITKKVWEGWLECVQTELNHVNHPRPVLAALCHRIALEKGLPVMPDLIMKRFNVGKSYQNWIPLVSV